MGEIYVVRHGQTEWSATGRHTSYTDLPLTPDGVAQASALKPALAGRAFRAVLTSTRRRAAHTAELAGLTPTDTDADLEEWNYGDYEGITTPQIRDTNPGWDLWTDGCPDGETPAQVGARLDRVLARLTPLLAQGDVAIVGHGHSLRVLGARWIGLPAADGALLRLDTSTVSVLGHERERRVLQRWNSAS